MQNFFTLCLQRHQTISLNRVVGVQNLLRTRLIVTAMLSVMLQDMAFTLVGCCRLLAKMHISAARDKVFCYMTLRVMGLGMGFSEGRHDRLSPPENRW